MNEAGNGSGNGSAQARPGNGSAAGRSKAFAVFTIVETNEERALWRRVGSGFVNRDGSYNLCLDALPVNGRLHMREAENAPLNHERA